MEVFGKGRLFLCVLGVIVVIAGDNGAAWAQFSPVVRADISEVSSTQKAEVLCHHRVGEEELERCVYEHSGKIETKVASGASKASASSSKFSPAGSNLISSPFSVISSSMVGDTSPHNFSWVTTRIKYSYS